MSPNRYSFSESAAYGAAQNVVGGLAPVVEQLTRRAEWLTEQQAKTLRERSPSYRSGQARIPDDALLSSAHRNVDRAIRTLRDGRSPRPKEIHEAWVARERTEQGLPAAEMLDAYRLAHRVLREAFVELAVERKVDSAHVALGVCLLCDTADAGASQLYAVRSDFELATARLDEKLRLQFLDDLLRGQLSTSSLREFAPSYRLALDRPYLAVRARPLGATSADRLLGQLQASSSHYGQGALLGIVDTEVVGVVPSRPDLGDLEAIVGISASAHLTEAAHSFRTASRMLAVAMQYGGIGVFDMSDLGLRVAMAAEPELASLMSRRYLSPMDAHGDFGIELIATLREYFATGRHITRTARRLGVHPNSLRHRLHRFEEIVGVSLEEPKVLTELWWALEANVGADENAIHPS